MYNDLLLLHVPAKDSDALCDIYAAAVFVHVISLINFVHVTYLLGCTSVYLE